jgi:hypothetical protein
MDGLCERRARSSAYPAGHAGTRTPPRIKEEFVAFVKKPGMAYDERQIGS